MYKEYGVYGSFSIDSTNLLYLSLQISLFKYTIKTSFSLWEWKLYCKIKPWSTFVCAGPLFIKIININKLDSHIHAVLKENEDNMHSES